MSVAGETWIFIPFMSRDAIESAAAGIKVTACRDEQSVRRLSVAGSFETSIGVERGAA